MSNESLQSLQQEMMSRMTGVYEYARATARDDSTLETRMSAVHNHARLYFKYRIPTWPIKMLLRKVMRRLFFPMMMPQVVFNEAVRDVLQEMRQSQQRQLTVQGETLSMVAELEEQIDVLTSEVATLREALTAARTSSEAAVGTMSS